MRRRVSSTCLTRNDLNCNYHTQTNTNTNTNLKLLHKFHIGMAIFKLQWSFLLLFLKDTETRLKITLNQKGFQDEETTLDGDGVIEQVFWVMKKRRKKERGSIASS